MAGGGSGLGKPLLAASAAFLAGAFFGCSASRDAALALGAGALVLALHARVRFAALGLALGLLRGASHEQPAAFTVRSPPGLGLLGYPPRRVEMAAGTDVAGVLNIRARRRRSSSVSTC